MQVLMQSESTEYPPIFRIIIYAIIIADIPDTQAENRKITGMSGVDHVGFALTPPNIKPT